MRITIIESLPENLQTKQETPQSVTWPRDANLRNGSPSFSAEVGASIGMEGDNYEDEQVDVYWRSQPITSVR